MVKKLKKHSKEDIVKDKKKRVLFTCFFIFLVIVTIYTVTMSNDSFSYALFFKFVKESNPLYIILSFISVILFIAFEGLAIRSIAASFGYKKKVSNSFVYSSADIYFSAITPSATGGQPMSAYFMYKDGIPGTIIAITLLYNLMMYSSSFIILGIITFLIKPSIFFRLHFLSKILILFGVLVQTGIFLGFYFLLYKEQVLNKICSWLINVGKRLHLIRDEKHLLNKLHEIIHEYNNYALMLKSKKHIWIKAFLYNALQRIAQIGVVIFVFLATCGNNIKDLFAVWTTQMYVIFGAYCIPIPGGMGVSDYLMLDGFNNIMDSSMAANLQLFSRSISFYFCIIICGIIVLIRYLFVRRGKK